MRCNAAATCGNLAAPTNLNRKPNRFTAGPGLVSFYLQGFERGT